MNKIIINREKDSRYSCKNRRIVDKEWKDFNNTQSMPTQADWNWDLLFDWDLGSGWASNYQDNSSIQASPTLSCMSTSSFPLKSLYWADL